MRLFFFSLIFTLFSSAISAQTGNTYINFGIRNAGITVDGVFETFTANADINPDDLSNATFNGTIRVKSINTGISKRDKDLLKSGYFDEENFPKIIFIATSVKKLGDG
ncbi:MAG: YceI family protein, partial [Cryomorphaceae bacterium]|nr:YceI family protein [Cryomorphaceae bacterium]